MSTDARCPRIASGFRAFLAVLAILLFCGSAICGGFAIYWFVNAQVEKNSLELRWHERRQQGNSEAQGVRTIVELMSGLGPLGMEAAILVKIQTMEKDAWKYLSFSLALGIAGYLGVRRSPPVWPTFRLRGRWLFPLIGLVGVAAVVAIAAWFVWPGYIRPIPHHGVGLSGNLDYILSKSHLDAIRIGMTFDEVQLSLDVAEEKRPLDPWITNVSEAQQFQRKIGQGNLRCFEIAKKACWSWGRYGSISENRDTTQLASKCVTARSWKKSCTGMLCRKNGTRGASRWRFFDAYFNTAIDEPSDHEIRYDLQ